MTNCPFQMPYHSNTREYIKKNILKQIFLAVKDYACARICKRSFQSSLDRRIDCFGGGWRYGWKLCLSCKSGDEHGRRAGFREHIFETYWEAESPSGVA